MTGFILTHDRQHNSYLLVGDCGRAFGSLVVDKRFRHGEVAGDAGRTQVHSHGFRRRSVSTGDEQPPLIHLNMQRSWLPGFPDAQWKVRRNHREYFGTLTTSEGSMELAFAGGEPGQIQILGNWPDAYFAVLAASFALLARRRGDTMLKSALVSIASGGGH